MRVKNSYFWLVAIAGVILDQLTKFWTVQTLPLNQGGIEVIPNVLYFFSHHEYWRGLEPI